MQALFQSLNGVYFGPLDKNCIIKNNFSCFSNKTCCGYSKEPSQRALPPTPPKKKKKKKKKNS